MVFFFQWYDCFALHDFRSLKERKKGKKSSRSVEVCLEIYCNYRKHNQNERNNQIMILRNIMLLLYK